MSEIRICPTRVLVKRAVMWLCIYLATAAFTMTTAPPLHSLTKHWKLSTGSRTWAFPRDHGSHPDYRTEWWYFTGNLESDGGRRFGYQVTFFRQGIKRTGGYSDNSWELGDLYLGHFALTDVSAGNFYFAERVSRKGPGLAFSVEEGLNMRLLDWTSNMKDGKIYLHAQHGNMKLALVLSPEKPPVLHGSNGLSVKGPEKGQASWYVSMTRLETGGVLTLPDSVREIRVSGSSWFDHEFGSNQLSSEQVGWDWFSLHISDGSELMLYMIRRRDGMVEPSSSGTLVEPDGSWRHVGQKEVEVKPLDYWKSGTSGGTYPSRWRVIMKDAGMDLELWPLVPDQELVTSSSTGITYWEGAVEGRGSSDGERVTCKGYVELTGYAGELGGTF